ncbi:MAG TPA: hypothetical protein VHC20_01895 [Candidatus Paceibacterota bacterium]|nr:hypothetical protein [Candidatus Paceibacterota bacterium]
MHIRRFAFGIPVLVLGLFFTLSPAAHATYKPAGIEFLPFMGFGTGSATPLGVTNTKTLTYSFWLMGTADEDAHYSLQGNQFLSDPSSDCEVTSGHPSPGLCGSVDDPYGRFQMSFNDSTGTVSGTDDIKFQAQAGSNAVWHHYLVSMDSANQVGALYIDGSLYTARGNPLISANAIPDLNNANGFHIPGSGRLIQYEADIVAAETSVVCTGTGTPASMNGIAVTCAAPNTIPPEIVSKFINGSGKPVDLGTGCANPFGGRQSEVCVAGSTIGNTGSGHSMASELWGLSGLGGAGTPDYGGVFTAPFGPWGIPDHQATMRWVQEQNPADVVTSNGFPGALNKDYMTTYAASNPIAVGDLIVILGGISSNYTINDAHMICPSGFTTVGPVVDSGYPAGETNSILCYKFATSADASGTGAYNIYWDIGKADRMHDWLMADYTNVASVDKSGSNYNRNVTSHQTASGLTTTSGNETVVSAWANWNAAVNQFIEPSTGTLRFRLPDNIASPMQLMLVDEYGVSKGSNPQRTMTTASADSSAGYTLTLVPN